MPRLREALGSYERVLWIDADAVIVDTSQDFPGVPVEERRRAMQAALA